MGLKTRQWRSGRWVLLVTRQSKLSEGWIAGKETGLPLSQNLKTLVSGLSGLDTSISKRSLIHRDCLVEAIAAKQKRLKRSRKWKSVLGKRKQMDVQG